jgi:hypothetical protein
VRMLIDAGANKDAKGSVRLRPLDCSCNTSAIEMPHDAFVIFCVFVLFNLELLSLFSMCGANCVDILASSNPNCSLH